MVQFQAVIFGLLAVCCAASVVYGDSADNVDMPLSLRDRFYKTSFRPKFGLIFILKFIDMFAPGRFYLIILEYT
jgi:hypothetical protein